MITLRPASIDDLKLLKYWDTQPHVISADPNDDWEWEKELKHSPAWREQLIAELDGLPIGFIQIIDPALEESHYWGDISAGYRAIDIWIGESENLGKGYGSVIMQLAINSCFSNPGVHTILIDPLASNRRAHQFYERLGFRFVEPHRFGNDDCFIYRLDRENWEAMNKNH
jgi:aminoglycoside 6'-N-acetyltransferase